MDEYTREMIESEAREMAKAKNYESYKWHNGYVCGMNNIMMYHDIITEEEYTELKQIIEHYDNLYWNTAKSDFASAHRRIFPEQ